MCPIWRRSQIGHIYPTHHHYFSYRCQPLFLSKMATHTRVAWHSIPPHCWFTTNNLKTACWFIIITISYHYVYTDKQKRGVFWLHRVQADMTTIQILSYSFHNNNNKTKWDAKLSTTAIKINCQQLSTFNFLPFHLIRWILTWPKNTEHK
jgi:hypothetical protein